MTRLHRASAASAFGLLVLTASVPTAVRADSGAIYSCTDGSGKRLTSDRPIADCVAREQRVLNADGSVRRIVPAAMTADQRLEQEARDRKTAAERSAGQDASRRDRTLLLRYPNEAAHAAARRVALDDVRKATTLSEQRMAALQAERKPLVAEAEFYAHRTLPAGLKQQLEANDAAADAQRALIDNQHAEAVRINGQFDLQLFRLRRLWAGAEPGSLGPLPTALPVR